MTLEQLVAKLDMGSVKHDHALDETLLPTIAPKIRETQGRSRPKARQRSDSLLRAGEEKDSHTLKMKGPIAEGGMGKILLAEQSGLRRDVAVKTLRDQFLEPAFAHRLLREARILAMVEHPNVVPLYALQTDDRDSPRMVMKRIEGVPWREMIRDPEHPAFPKRARDRLAWHLRVLMRICDAMQYAHSRGIVHLDLKPENVMIGSFREVVLVDWGVACSLRKERRGWVPVVDEITEVLGTPAYLAPEMVDPARQEIGERTDVFLLGATLYEILTGSPPHRGANIQAMLYAAYAWKAPQLQDVPRELSEIVHRSMHHDVDERYESVEELRAAIADYLERRHALGLADQAQTSLKRLRQQVARAEIGAIHATSDSDNANVQRTFAICRFGFGQALRESPGLVEAERGMAEALALMAGYHLARSEAASAETLLEELAELGEVDEPELHALREEAERQRRAAVRFEKMGLEEEQDPSGRARGRLLMAAAVLVAVPCAIAWGMSRTGIYTHRWWHALAFDLMIFGVFGLGGMIAAQRSLLNRRGRRLLLTFVTLAGLAAVLRGATYALGLHDLRSTSLELICFGGGSLLAGLLSDRRFYRAAPGFLLGAAAILIWPEHTLLWIGLSTLLGAAPLGLAWMKGAPPMSPLIPK